MNAWPYHVDSHTKAEILLAVDDPEWQTFRKTLKGLPTTMKLNKLQRYLLGQYTENVAIAWVRVDNYINALRRGGQLDLDNKVQR